MYGHPNYSFIGSYLPGELAFTPEDLLSDYVVQNFTGTAEGGPNWVEFLSGCAVEDGTYLPAECPIQLWDFAFAGADVTSEYLPPHHNSTIPLVNQTQQYLTWADPVLAGGAAASENEGDSQPQPYFSRAARAASRSQGPGSGVGLDRLRALVAVWIGINDINDSLSYKPANVTYADFWDGIISALFGESVGLLVDAGYRNFLFMNLPPLDRTAANQVRDEAERKPTKSQIDLWNGILDDHRTRFEVGRGADGVKTMLYDANTFLNGVLDDPTPYGITNLTYCPAYAQLDVLTDPGKYGCQPLDEYFWYNSGHM
jgi:hypothetical protein